MKKLMHVVMGVIIGTIISTGIVYAADELIVNPNPFPVYINGVETPVEAYNINGFTYLKLADLEKAGLEVMFNETQRRIEIVSATLITQAKEEREASVLANVPINEYGLPDLSNVPAKYLTFEEVPVERVTFAHPIEDKIDKFLTYNGVKYIRTRTRWGTSAVPNPKVYSFKGKKVDGKGILTLTKWKSEESAEFKPGVPYEWVTIVSRIPYTIAGGETYIPYDYYVNTLLPLMEEGAD